MSKNVRGYMLNFWLEYKIKDVLFVTKNPFNNMAKLKFSKLLSSFCIRPPCERKCERIERIYFSQNPNPSVTNAENGQLVRAFASTIIHKRNLRMGFSLPSPAVSHPDMPFMAWVRNYQLSCIIWLYNIQHSSKLTGTSDYYTAT